MNQCTVKEKPILTELGITSPIRTESLSDNLGEYEHRNFSTKSLTLTGKMDLNIPGRERYTCIDELSLSYEHPMEVDLSGCIVETEGILEVNTGRLEVTAYRINKAETALDKTYGIKEIVAARRYPDPEVTMYIENRKIVLNQVIGIPVVNIEHGKLTYSR